MGTTTSTWRSSGHIGLPVEDGMVYSLGIQTDCKSGAYGNVYYQYGGSSRDAGIGSSNGYQWNTGDWTSYSVGDSVSPDQTSYNNAYDFPVRVYVTDLDAPTAGVCP
jgi:hypothetical protein